MAAAAPGRENGGGRGRLQPEGGAERLPGGRDGAQGGAARTLPARLEGARPVS